MAITSKISGSITIPNTVPAQQQAGFPRSITPKVDINYASGLFSQDGVSVTESSLITYSRGSVSTFVDRRLSDVGTYSYFLNTETTGSVQRIEYDPATGENLGALIESGSTNLCLQSEVFDDVAWSTSSATIAVDDAISPDLSVTADGFTAGSTATITPTITQSVTSIASGAYTSSFFVKRGSEKFLQLFFTGSDVANDPRVNFDLSLGTITAQDADIAQANIDPVGEGWFRISATVVAAGVTMGPILSLIKSGTDLRNVSNSFTAGEGVFIWGAQIEAKELYTSYIQTVGATVARLPDLVSILQLGNAPQTDSTFFLDVHRRGGSTAADDSQFYSFSVTGGGFKSGYINTSGGIGLRDASATEIAAAGTFEPSFKVAYTFNSLSNIAAGFLNGVQTVSEDNGAIALPFNNGSIGIGNLPTLNTEQLNGHIKQFVIYPEALTEQEVSLL